MSLFTRVIGTDDQGDKIAIHLVHALIVEVINNRQSSTSVAVTLGLDADEIVDLNRMLLILSTVQSKTKSSSRIFNYLLLGEIKINNSMRDYTSEELFWQMVESE